MRSFLTFPYLKSGKVALECPVNQLAQNIHKMASHARFHETIKAAIRPSPADVFKKKVDDSQGKRGPAEEMYEKRVEEEIGPMKMEAGEEKYAQAAGPCTICDCRKFIQKAEKVDGETFKDEDGTMNPEELGTQASGFSGGGPFTCMNCVWRTPHSTDEGGKEVDSCRHPKIVADPDLEDRKLPDGTIKVDYDDCCRFVRPPKGKS